MSAVILCLMYTAASQRNSISMKEATLMEAEQE
jgi:hypothetical protein